MKLSRSSTNEIKIYFRVTFSLPLQLLNVSVFTTSIFTKKILILLQLEEQKKMKISRKENWIVKVWKGNSIFKGSKLIRVVNA